MLGEQLIRSDRIALVELVKNSYDADATLVTVDFRDFNEDMTAGPGSAIVVRDDGSGMSESVVREAWLNPATPSKRLIKMSNPRTERGRILQGEKGIGRFAAFKLGREIHLSSRTQGSPTEVTVAVDIAMLDEGTGAPSEMYLDELPVMIESGSPIAFEGGAGASSHGTQIEIRNLRGSWSNDAVENSLVDVLRLQPLHWVAPDQTQSDDFRVEFLRDGVPESFRSEKTAPIDLILERAVLTIDEGRFDVGANEIDFLVNGARECLKLDGPELRGNSEFIARFKTGEGEWRRPECGPFEFKFYVFDLNGDVSEQFRLDPQEKTALKQHRIYLYRDGVRVYPYGDPDDDWLRIDATRGTRSARTTFSNDQTVGYVAISQAHNPDLRDKTSREGLLDVGNATEDFVALLQSVLSFVRGDHYAKYLVKKRQERESKLEKTSGEGGSLDSLVGDKSIPASARAEIARVANAIAAERELSRLQIERLEDLAAVGLSIEMASHDLIAAGSESLRTARLVRDELRSQGHAGDYVYELNDGLIRRLEFVSTRFEDVQGLFVSTRAKPGALDVLQYAKRVRSIYSALLSARKVEVEIEESFRFSGVTTEGALLMALINLFDNAVYWLSVGNAKGPRRIRIFCEAPNRLVFSDNGPGIRESDEPYIVEPFYSGKGESGQGLGLYIARSVGLRNGFRVDLDAQAPRAFPSGATFAISFEKVEA